MNRIYSTEEIKKKKNLLHINYPRYFTQFENAIRDGYQIERLMIIYAIFEHITNLIIVKLASISGEYKTFFSNKVKKKMKLRCKMQLIRCFVLAHENEILNILEKQIVIDDMVNALDVIDKYHNLRNTVVHRLMINSISDEEIKCVNEDCKNAYKKLKKVIYRENKYIKINGCIEVDDIVTKLEAN